jgi:hypothetical protein
MYYSYSLWGKGGAAIGERFLKCFYKGKISLNPVNQKRFN